MILDAIYSGISDPSKWALWMTKSTRMPCRKSAAAALR